MVITVVPSLSLVERLCIVSDAANYNLDFGIVVSIHMLMVGAYDDDKVVTVVPRMSLAEMTLHGCRPPSSLHLMCPLMALFAWQSLSPVGQLWWVSLDDNKGLESGSAYIFGGTSPTNALIYPLQITHHVFNK